MVLSAVPPQAFAAEMEETVPVETVTETTVPETAETALHPDVIPETTVTTEATIPETEAVTIEPVETVPEETEEETVAVEETEEALAAASGMCGRNCYWNLSNGKLSIHTQYAGTSSMDSYTQASETPWYAYKDQITSVEIRGITYIGDYAFAECDKMVSITYPSGIWWTGNYSLQNCTSLENVYISSLYDWCDLNFGTDGHPMKYAEHLYLNGKELTNVVIPDNVTVIQDKAFYSCENLTSVTLPEGLENIKYEAFMDCVSLEAINIPQSVTEIGYDAFAGCAKLKSVDLPNTLTTIGSGLFSGCAGLTSVTLPDQMTRIGNNMFEGCASLKSVSIPQTVTQIGYYAFSGCSSLEAVDIPEGVTSIGFSAFSGCSSLKSFVFPSGITEVAMGILSKCVGLTELIVPEGVTTIGRSAFSGCTNLTKVRIPDTVTKIDSLAFGSCTAMDSIYIPASVTTINGYYSNEGPFYGCDPTMVLHCGAQEKASGWDYYWNYQNPARLTVKYGVNRTDYEFWSAYEETAKTLEIPAEITNIPAGAFSGSALETVTIFGDGVTIGSNAFGGSQDLKDIWFYGEPGQIDKTAFSGLTATVWYPANSEQWENFDKTGYGDNLTWKTFCVDGHVEVVNAAVAPTCTETGLTEGRSCANCDVVMVAQQVISALGHTQVVDVAVEPDCTNTGLTEGSHCSVCGEVFAKQTVIPALGHKESVTVTLEPTCTTAGCEKVTCTVCDYTEDRELASLGHVAVVDTAVAATCLNTGLTEGKHCSRCNEVLVKQTVTSALGHKSVTDRAVAPTCTKTGLTEGSHCSRCSAVLVARQTVAALGHVEVVDAYVAPTCTKTGLTEGKHCSRCSATLVAQRTIASLGHAEVVDVAVAATCLDTGLTEGKHCSRCSAVLIAQTVVPALGHDEVEDAYLAPTCLETGLTKGKHCGRCAEVLIAQESIPALGHTPAVDVYVAPTCLETGLTEGGHCSVCNAVLTAQEVIPALGHDEIMDAYVAPTCLETGLTEGKHCGRCAEVLIAQEMIPANGHDYDVGLCRNCDAELPSAYQLFAGKSLSIKITNPATGKPYTAKQLVWTLDERFEPFATMKAGKLTAKKVVERARIEIVGTVVATEETISYFVDIYPAVTQAEITRDGEVLNGKTILMDFEEEKVTLKLDVYPLDTQAKITWSISDKQSQYAGYTIEGNTLTIANASGRAGTVTIKATVDAGAKKNVTVKVNFGSFARKVTIFDPSKTTIRGGETLQLDAYVSEPRNVSKPGILWSVSDKNAASISGGKLKAKNVTHPTVVTVIATSLDGQASASVDIEIIPKDEGKLVLMSGTTFVTNSTKTMNIGESYQVTAAIVTNGDSVAQSVNWSSNKETVARVEDGLITATGAGTAKITAEYNGMTAVIHVKVSTLAKDMEITTKDGKNLAEENGEKIVVVSSGKGVNLVANILTGGAAKAVTWEILEGGAYGKIAPSGKFTANKDLTKVAYVTVKATAKDGSNYAEMIRVKILPLATGVQIYQNGTKVRSNTVLIVDLLSSPVLKLNARVFPARANQAVQLTSSSKKIADFNADGDLVCFKTGTVTITAQALDGSNAKTTFKLTVIKQVTSLTLKDGVVVDAEGNQFVAGGKTLKLAPVVEISPSDATNKKLTWKVSPNDYGITISSSGVLKTRKVSRPVTVNIMVTTQDGSGLMLSFDVTVYPV